MKKAINLLLYIGSLILLWFTIEMNYMPQFFIALLIAFGIYRYYSTMKSIKSSSKRNDGLRVKKMTFNLYSFFILFLLVKELFFSDLADVYFVIILSLLEIVIILESYLEKKHQKIVFYIENQTLYYNAITPLERNLEKLIALNFHSIGNYFVLVFEKQSSITIDRDQFITSELNAFMNQLLSQCPDNVKVAIEAKEKIELA